MGVQILQVNLEEKPKKRASGVEGAGDGEDEQYLFKAQIAAVGSEGGGQVDQILLELESELQHIGRDEHVPQHLPNGRERDRLQVEQEDERPLSRTGRVGTELGVADSASDLEDGDGREGRGRIRGSNGFPFGI